MGARRRLTYGCWGVDPEQGDSGKQPSEATAGETSAPRQARTRRQLTRAGVRRALRRIDHKRPTRELRSSPLELSIQLRFIGGGPCFVRREAASYDQELVVDGAMFVAGAERGRGLIKVVRNENAMNAADTAWRRPPRPPRPRFLASSIL